MWSSSRTEAAPEHRGHGIQFDRLHQVLVETSCQRALPVALLPEPGQSDDQRAARLGQLAKPANDLVTVHGGHPMSSRITSGENSSATRSEIGRASCRERV